MVYHEGLIFTKPECIASRRVDQEAVVIKVGKFPEAEHNERVLRYLNKTGVFIWELIDGKNTLKVIVDSVMDHFEVDFQSAKKDIVEFLELLSQEGLIVEKRDGLNGVE